MSLVKIDPENAVLFLQASVELRLCVHRERLRNSGSQERRDKCVCTSPQRTQFVNPLRSAMF
jgi:hypothetical protein